MSDTAAAPAPEPTFEDMKREMLAPVKREPPPEPKFDEPEPEPTAEPQADEPKSKEPAHKEESLPPSAILEERRRRQAAEQRAEQLAKDLETGNKRLQEMLAAFAPKPPEPPKPEPLPDVDRDPVANLKAVQEQLRAIEADRREQQTRQQQADVYQSFVQKYAADAHKFAAETPDFTNAYGHLIGELRADLQAAGYTQSEIGQQVANYEQQLAVRAWDAGANPAERIYNMALRRGYQKPQVVPPPSDTMQTIERGQRQAGKSLGQAGAAPGGGGDAFEAMARMSPEEWASVPLAKRLKALRGY